MTVCVYVCSIQGKGATKLNEWFAQTPESPELLKSFLSAALAALARVVQLYSSTTERTGPVGLPDGET